MDGTWVNDGLERWRCYGHVVIRAKWTMVEESPIRRADEDGA